MTTNQETQQPSLPTFETFPTIEVKEAPEDSPSVAPSLSHEQTDTGRDSDAPRKHKRRSGSSIDLTYRYHEPSEDELSWTEDEHGQRRRRKSHKKKSGGGDDFKNGIVYVFRGKDITYFRPAEGKKRRKRRRSGQNAQEDDGGGLYTDSGSEDESDNSNSGKK